MKALLLATIVTFGSFGSSYLRAADADVFVSKPSRVTVIELFTSEGCSSCPPAERWLAHYLDDEKLWRDVIPIAMHVDYWDYLGWKDKFASPEFSARQRLYKTKEHTNAVYTPGFMVNGEEWRGFFNPISRNAPLAIHEQSTEPGMLVLTRTDTTIEIEYKGSHGEELIANVAYLGSGLEQPIARGENAGKVLTHNFVVLKMAQKPGKNAWSFDIQPPVSANAVVAFLSRPGDPQPLQAVGGAIFNRTSSE